MRIEFRSKVLLVSVIVVAAICCVVVLHNFTQRKDPKKGNIFTTLLEVPLFISSAEAQTASAFPADEAGIAAYAKVLSVDIEKIKALLTEAEEVGDNYIVGIMQIQNFGGTIGVHLYADTDGWLVAYIGADDQAAKVMQWGDADPKNPQISVIQTTTLEDALYSAGDAVGAVVAQKDIKYYDFEAPAANEMALFIRTKTGKGENIVQAELPATYVLYDASYYHYTYGSLSNKYVYWGESELKVDGSRVNYIEGGSAYYVNVTPESYWGVTVGSYKGAVTTGKLHKIAISHNYESGASGVATLLIYKSQ